MAGGLPVGELLLVAGLAFAGDALLQGGGGFEFVWVIGALLGGEFAFEGVFEQRLAINLELGLGGFQAFDALVQLGEQFLDFGDDALLLCYRRKANCYLIHQRRFCPSERTAYPRSVMSEEISNSK